ncbi:hypothetical protein [Antricoccus suffuscus]|nr:hypothetical protein [Antricoccus suffuscus]
MSIIPRPRSTETRAAGKLKAPDWLLPQLRDFLGITTPPAGPEMTEGNSRLTAVSGMMLFALLAVEGVTVLNVRGMITLHVYLGILLVGPVLLKCASTIYRFVRYYTGAPAYVQKGPPHPILRLLGPVVILSSLAVLGTGIGLVFVGPDHSEPLLTLHQASFIVWLVVVIIHVLGHILRASTTTWRELRDPHADPAVRGRRWRVFAAAASLVVGVGLATALLPSAHSWTDRQHNSHQLSHFDRTAHGTAPSR